MNTRSQNILLAARSLLENSGPTLNSASDVFTVVRKMLVAHDAAELVLAALLIEAEQGHKLTEKVLFQNLVNLVFEKYCEDDDDETRNVRRQSLNALNYVRVRFKHHGDLPDAPSTFPIVEEALRVTDLLCERAVGMPLREVSALASLVHEAIAEQFRDAEKLIERGEFRQALESIARAVSTAFWDYDVRGVTVGKPDSQGALLLSGRGIDPASFLSMQQFLPLLYSPFHEAAEFETRQYGHEANWTVENAQFCWDTALAVVLRLQHARSIPEAREFYDEYEDVITIKTQTSTVYRYKGFWAGQDDMPGETFTCKEGRNFCGKASGFYDLRIASSLELPMPLGAC